MRKLITAALAAAALAGGVLAASPALAAPAAGTVTASTSITGRPDSGGAGNTWALDAMTRTLAVTETGASAGVYSFTATVRDSAGTFAVQAGQLVPNQGTSPGARFGFQRRQSGTFSGGASFSFTATALPSAARVPHSATGSGPTDTSDWYKLAFPAGTTFGGTGIEDNWGWSYTDAEACNSLGGPAVFTQAWRDFASNDGGQGSGGSPAQGGIVSVPNGSVCPVAALRLPLRAF